MDRLSSMPRVGGSLAALALATSIATVGLAAPVSAFAADPPAQGSPPPKPGLNLNMGMNQIDKMLDKVDATPDQRTKIKAILMDAFMSMGSLAPEVKATVSGLGKSLMAPRVSRADLEAARLSTVADFDAFTKVMFKAIGDAADTLTPEQRAKLAKSASKHEDTTPAAKPKTP